MSHTIAQKSISIKSPPSIPINKGVRKGASKVDMVVTETESARLALTSIALR